MANNKNYARWIDIPDGNGGYERKWLKDEDAQNIIGYDFDFVDLGLPSGTLWATKNVGAQDETDSGLYFSWGNTEGHSAGYNFSSGNYNGTVGSTIQMTDPSSGSDESFEICIENCFVPTNEQYTEFVHNCTFKKITIDGVSVIQATSKLNGKTIMLPCSGYYECTVKTESSMATTWLCGLNGYSGGAKGTAALSSSAMHQTGVPKERYFGFPVRLVTSSLVKRKADKSYVDEKLAEKQDVINDLGNIRSGAALGATALQEITQSQFNAIFD